MLEATPRTIFQLSSWQPHSQTGLMLWCLPSWLPQNGQATPTTELYLTLCFVHCFFKYHCPCRRPQHSSRIGELDPQARFSPSSFADFLSYTLITFPPQEHHVPYLDILKIMHLYETLINWCNKSKLAMIGSLIKNRNKLQYILSRLSQLNCSRWNITQHSFEDSTPLGVKPFTNIIATLDPEVDRRLVLAAHYDSKLIKNFLGATDSALSVALLLDLALTLDQKLRDRQVRSNDCMLGVNV